MQAPTDGAPRVPSVTTVSSVVQLSSVDRIGNGVELTSGIENLVCPIYNVLPMRAGHGTSCGNGCRGPGLIPN